MSEGSGDRGGRNAVVGEVDEACAAESVEDSMRCVVACCWSTLGVLGEVNELLYVRRRILHGKESTCGNTEAICFNCGHGGRNRYPMVSDSLTFQ